MPEPNSTDIRPAGPAGPMPEIWHISDTYRIDPRLIIKFNNSRTSHANRSDLANRKNPAIPIYTARQLREQMGWTNEAMHDTWIEQLPQRCPCPDWCDNLLMDVPWDQISIDIIEPDLPPVWGIQYNTRFMILSCNSRKNRLTRAQFIEMRAAELLRTTPRTPSPTPPTGQPPWPPPTAAEPIATTRVKLARCPSMKWKLHTQTRTNQARTLKPSTWRCVLEVGHDGPHRARESAHQAPWFDVA